jgi:anthranilate synthase component 1
MIQPSFEEFRVLAKRGNLIPVYQELLMDLETPLSFFKRLERDRYAFLLESVEGSERWARYSFLGTHPYRVFKARGTEVEIIEGGKSRRFNSEAPLKALQQLLENCRPVSIAGVPPFFGGALGYVSYNAVEQFHHIRNSKKDPLDLPEIFFLFVQTLIAFDNLKHTIKVIDNIQLAEKTDLRAAYNSSVRRIRSVISTLQKKPRGIEPRDVSPNRANRKFRSNLSKAQFAGAVVKGKEYIKAGDIIQVVLCQRLETETDTDPFEIMLVDLGRNDVGRVARVGTVEVNELMAIERYSHVIHIVSNVRGKLADDQTAFDLFVSAFPAGTVSGAPKIRAMQIISELEPQKRGLYAGAIGYFGYNGNLDTCIVIRTIVMKRKKVFITAGAGIVADSDPETEYQETLNKARAMLKAVALAEQWSQR